MRRAAVALFLIPTFLTAQRPLGSERDDIRRFTGDIWGVWTAPLHTTSHDLPPTAGALGIVALAGLHDSATWAWMNTHPNTFVMRILRPIREEWRFPLYELGSGQYILPLSGALYVAGRVSHNADLRDAGLGCATGHLASLGVRDVMYELVSRARPRVTSEPYHISFPGSKDWSWHSFISGHIANSMACASFLGHRYSLGLAEPLPYLYSTAIGLGRMADGRHWLSDTMAGAVVGFAIGRTVAARQLSRAARDAQTSRVLAPSPLPMVTWSFAF